MIRINIDPIMFQLGPLAFSWHGLFTAIAVVVAVWLGLSLAQRYNVDQEKLSNLIIWIIVGGVVGARLMHVLDHLSYYSQNPVEIIAVWKGGIAVYGSFIGGIVAGLIAARLYRLPVWPLLDAAAPAMLVGQMIGRIGCLINGDAWGEPTNAGWGLVYVNPGAQLPSSLIGVPTHPYPVYEIVACGLLLVIVFYLWRRVQVPGVTFLVAAIGYGVIRFGLTYFRQETIVAFGLQEAQVIALITIVLSLILLLVRLGFNRSSYTLTTSEQSR